MWVEIFFVKLDLEVLESNLKKFGDWFGVF